MSYSLILVCFVTAPYPISWIIMGLVDLITK